MLFPESTQSVSQSDSPSKAEEDGEYEVRFLNICEISTRSIHLIRCTVLRVPLYLVVPSTRLGSFVLA